MENCRGVSSTSLSPLVTRWRGRIEAQVADLEDRRPLARSATYERPQPRHQHDERERLGEEVVGARVERLRFLLRPGPRGQHQDRRPVTGLAAPGAQRVAAQRGQHDVEHQRVVAVLLRQPLALGAVQRDVDGVPLALEAATQGGRELLVVLDDQDPHPRTVAHPR